MSLRLRPLHATFGAEVVGVDLSREVDAATLAEIEAAWYRYSILLFRGVHGRPRSTSPSRGGWDRSTSWSRSEFNLPGHPEVLVVSNVEKDNKPIGMKRAGWGWHSDGEDKVLPNAGLVHPRAQAAAGRTATRCTPTRTPRSRRCPTTCVARSWGAARASPARASTRSTTRTCRRSLTEAQKKARPDVWHPIARRHPYPGWTSLYIGRWAYKIDGMDGRRSAGADRLPQGFRDAAGVRLPPPVAGRRRAAVGQPLRAALRNAVRRREVSAADAAHDPRG